ncbi:MAG TPA: 4-(cytidine 5'-diphospho)-2-C-methyl-D-erythritol kinase [candidate division Zixibacteria bacterium]|nr:4-(cytidine 5'-diphospho)-2-C-methyl-D-erythritol kinase [candidate division Zixibacteria bacterium]
MKIRAPAKINLGLRVTGKRKDGYHLIDSILAPISLWDEVEIRRRPVAGRKARPRRQISVSCVPPIAPRGRRNIAYRAAELLLSEARVDASIVIRIRKRIPVGAGLGGGSSDAAAALIGLNRLLRLGWTRRRLARLAVRLGADVPFFVYGRTARARGIGERLTPVSGLRRLWLVVLYPGFPVATSWAYRNAPVKLTKPIANTSITSRLRSLKGLPEILVNDLEAVTLARYPRIRRLKESLAQQGAVLALMSGSGSSVFGVFTSRQKAAQAFARLRKEEGVHAFLAHTLR